MKQAKNVVTKGKRVLGDLFVAFTLIDFGLTNYIGAKSKEQEPNDNMSAYGLFDCEQPARKWKKPEAPAAAPASPRGSAYLYNDFVGGCADGSPTKRWTPPPKADASPRVADSSVSDWVSSPNASFSARDRPAQIEIEGRKSIRDNPFLKNFKL